MTRQRMTSYLEGHFRYWTMNPWNRATSYARNIKIHRMKWKSRELESSAYGFLDVAEAYAGMRILLEEFAERHDHAWRIIFNGRSNGYLVMVSGGYNEHFIADPGMKPGSRDYSDHVGRWFTYGEALENGWIGKKYRRFFLQPGKGCGDDGTFDDWDMDALKGRARLVRDFDMTCDKAVCAFQDFVENHDTRMVEVPATRTVKVAVPRNRYGERKIETH
ncbi:MAG: hypothetical protein WAX69_11270 [Victivallales bacterium]